MAKICKQLLDGFVNKFNLEEHKAWVAAELEANTDNCLGGNLRVTLDGHGLAGLVMSYKDRISPDSWFYATADGVRLSMIEICKKAGAAISRDIEHTVLYDLEWSVATFQDGSSVKFRGHYALGFFREYPAAK